MKFSFKRPREVTHLTRKSWEIRKTRHDMPKLYVKVEHIPDFTGIKGLHLKRKLHAGCIR